MLVVRTKVVKTDGMIKIVKGHSDLRVKITGHTDSDGSDQYNDHYLYVSFNVI